MSDQWKGLLGDEGEALYRATGAIQTKAISLIADAQGEASTLRFQIQTLKLQATKQAVAHGAEVAALRKEIDKLRLQPNEE